MSSMEQRSDYETDAINLLSMSRRISYSYPGICRGEVDPKFKYYESLRKQLWPILKGEEENVLLYNSVKLESSSDDNDVVDDDVAEKPDIEIEMGKHFDVVSLMTRNYKTKDLVLLRNIPIPSVIRLNEKDKDFLKGKFVMICCFNVPIFRGDSNSNQVQSIANICFDLYARFGDDFEMIVVLKMHTAVNNCHVFNDFLSAFPPSCIVVPFTFSECRNYISNCLELGTMYAKCLILDGASNVLFFDIPTFSLYYGAEAFPFTPPLAHHLKAKDYPLWKSKPMSTLEGLLQCDSSFLLYKNDSPQERLPISALKDKVVGLYLYIRGDFLVKLNDMYEECRARNLEFEIVVAYLPYWDSLSPPAFHHMIHRQLHNLNISWWMVPFNDSVSRRLYQLTSFYWDDVLVILGPNDSYVDPCGREVMSSYKIDGFPFTRETIVQQALSKLQELNLESLLVYQSRNYVFHHDEQVSVENLRHRNVLLYFSCLEDLDLYNDYLFQWYSKLKEKDPSYEMVFIRRDDHGSYYAEPSPEDDRVARSLMPWLVCPFNPDHSKYVEDKLFPKFPPRDILVQFGTDGRVVSVEAHALLEAHGTDAFPFNNNLRQDIIMRMKNLHSFMDYYK